jgi:glycosyltransferase involved in cell wall biosynthesis
MDRPGSRADPEQRGLVFRHSGVLIMPDIIQYQNFKTLGCCVIIPTYNNDKTLEEVILKVLGFTDQVIVVNDGSTDRTTQVLEAFSNLTIIHLPGNKGKGYAIRLGFKEAARQGYRYAITIDSDGQHLPADLPKFIEMAAVEPEALIIGARNLDQAGIPGGTSFGNRFSNFWIRVETGFKLPDTQSGYRLYPLEKLGKMRFLTCRFEFEIEVLVRAAWKGIDLTSVPVSVIYPKKGERVSHFRPFTDFARISLLNTFFVILALLFFRPWMIFRKMSKDGFREMIRKHLLSPDESNFKKSASVALGIFMGIMPVWGWQMAIALALAIFFRLNKVITLVASNISIPPLIPFILLASYMTGGLILDNHKAIDLDSGITMEFVKKNFFQYILGALVFAAAMGILAGGITWILLTIFRRKQKTLPENHEPVEIMVDKSAERK